MILIGQAAPEGQLDKNGLLGLVNNTHVMQCVYIPPLAPDGISDIFLLITFYLANILINDRDSSN